MAHFRNEVLTTMLPAAGPCFIIVSMVYVAGKAKEFIQTVTTTENGRQTKIVEMNSIIVVSTMSPREASTRLPPKSELLSTYGNTFHLAFWKRNGTSTSQPRSTTATTEFFLLPDNTFYLHERRSSYKQPRFYKTGPLPSLQQTFEDTGSPVPISGVDDREAAIISELLTGQPSHEATFRPLLELRREGRVTISSRAADDRI